jgi:hypothetical protein
MFVWVAVTQQRLWYIWLLRICCLATVLVPFVSRPLPRNECCFRAVPLPRCFSGSTVHALSKYATTLRPQMFRMNVSPPSSRSKSKQNKKPTLSNREGACFLFGSFVDPEYGVCKFLRNAIGLCSTARRYNPRDLTLQERHRFGNTHTVWLFGCLASPYLVNGSDVTLRGLLYALRDSP